MRKKKRKIDIPTNEEVKKFGAPTVGTSGGQEPQPESAAQPETESKDAPTAEGGDAQPKMAAEEQIEALRKELEDVRDKLLRAKAENQNLLRRTAVEKSEAIRFANERFVKALLPVLDDFGLTLEAATKASSADSIVEGVRLVRDKLLKMLHDHHISVIEAEGKPFDPRLHNAAMQEPSQEHKPGTVTRELQRGYCLHDRVVRPAQVVLAASAKENGDSQPSPNEKED